MKDMRRRDKAHVTPADRFNVFDNAVRRYRMAQRIAAIEIRAPSPASMVVQARQRVTPTTLSNLTRIVDDKNISPMVRVKAAALLIKIGYGEPEEPEDPNDADG